MQKNNHKFNKKFVGATSSRPHSRGITLIALIITIIVMLILVGVTINVALNGGLFEVAKKAAYETKIEVYKEKLLSEVLAAYDVNTGTIDRAKLNTNLASEDWTVTSDGKYKCSEGFVFNVSDKGEIAYDEAGTQIESDKEKLQAKVLAASDTATGTINREELETILEKEGWTITSEGKYQSPMGNIFTVTNSGETIYIGQDTGNGEEEDSTTALDKDTDPLTIGSIEDLVDFAIAVNAGTTYEGETVTLLTSLNFDNAQSYRNSDDTSYGDINGNGTAEPIITELTTGLGFEPIGKITGTHAELGWPLANSFAGTFDGNEKTLNNLYINRPEGYAALFGDISTKATIKNLTIKNPEIYGMYASGLAISNAVPAELTGETLMNYANDVLTIEKCHTTGGKIGAVNEDCVSQISSGLLINPTIISLGKVDIKESSNRSIISGLRSTGIAYISELMAVGKITITKCENYGNIIIEDIDTYKVASEDFGSASVGCISTGQSVEGVVISECSNYGELTGVNSIVGVAVASNASVSNCSNYGTLSSLSGERILIAGVVCDNAEDAPPDGIEKKIEGCRNYGDINISSDNMNEFKVAGITNGSYKNKVLNCINEGNISISGTINYNSSGLVWQVAGINGRYDSLVTNCINYGNITVDTQWKSNNKGSIYISGISYAGDRIINCANYGTLKGGDAVAGIAYDNSRDVETQIYNCYNVGNGGIGAGAVIKNSCCLGNFGSNSTVDSSCHALTGNETPEEKQALLTELNNQVAIYNEELETDTETPWSEWKIDPNMNYGYPSFSWQQAEE